jgi:hypothetical protein
MEIWKDVVGYEGIYEISNLGRVKSLERSEWCGRNNSIRVRKEKFLTCGINRRGYRTAHLCKNGKINGHMVHRIVALAFIPNPNNLPHINHIDGNSSNNHIENLEWCDPKHNVNHAYENELTTTSDKTTLIHIETGESFHFRSKMKASEFLGKSPNYLSHHMGNGKSVLCGYEVISESNQWHERRL